MKVGFVSYPADSSPTGIGHYVINLLRELRSITTHEITPVRFKNYDNHPCNRGNEILIGYPTWLPNTLRTSLFFFLNRNFDVVHDTTSVGLLLPTHSKKVLTVHDLSAMLFPRICPNLWQEFAASFILPHTYARARHLDKIIAISGSTKRDLVTYLKIPSERVEVIYYGKDEKFALVKDDEELDRVRAKLSLPQKFILCVSTLQPRKNLVTLLKAFYKLRRRYEVDLDLVIIGGSGWKYSPIHQLVKILGIQKEVQFTGYVSNELLPAVYSMAEVFVYPSLYEGFGLPPLEAMACGCPVITSNISSMPEVVRDAGILVHPLDVDEFTEAIHAVLSNEGLKADIVRKGLIRAQFFSWRKAAKQTLRVYEEVYG